MPSERVQRQIDRLLDEADEASLRQDWQIVRDRASAALTFDPDNSDAASYLQAAERGLASDPPQTLAQSAQTPVGSSPDTSTPSSFANGRYTVTKFLGEGGKKKVYLARDSLLDRDVAFALIKTEGLDEASRVRVQREAQAMGRLGAHPHIVTVFDIGEEDGQPYLVLPVLAGGDVEGVIEKAPENKLTIERAVKIALDTCLGLEFAHSKGIVHRDLKPGNVWLTEDGRAMIGDFGLAVAVDKSRLTQAGMMVGTVSYMPPEQAMGGEVGPRSDLYSLGAMLYEMVCGRPPFVGDESVAIIGQHLNTPPVAPSWHRPDCPVSLETLILRLLEKDPSKRPASAEEVRGALEGINTATWPRDPTVATEVPAPGDNPLYRRTFVGRENEMRQLQQAFDAALSGQGGLVMVVGEPGIGKTALCEQLATYVALRGGKALVGHCYEEGSLSLPYLAFVEAMRSYVLAREPDGLRSDLGTGAADVARIVSEVRDRVQGVELRPAGDPEDDRWRLLQAVTSFLRNASTVQPLCIVLEDLHWADRGTLDLLLHVSRNLQGARLLMVGTYRDVEVDRAHPLSNTLADLRRGTNFSRVPLRGLTVDEVHRMYEAIRGNDVPWGQAEAVHRATEGNPLFVQEVLRYLVEEGFVVREDGRYVAQQGAGAGIPEGLRDVVGKRLSRLGEKTNQVLAVAAVMGRDFRLDVLQIVAGIPEDDLYSALAEAVERAIIEERSGVGVAVAYRFAHAFFRQTLYEEAIAPRRIRLHQQVARALETVYGRRLDEHAAELAEHYSHSSSPDDLMKAVEYGELAARRATGVFDYGEAERHLHQALAVQEVLNPDDRSRLCDLLLSIAEVLGPAGRPEEIEPIADRAFALAEELHDSRRASRASQAALYGLFRQGGLQRTGALLGLSDEWKLWSQRADRYATEGTADRAHANIAMAVTLRLSGATSKSIDLVRQALSLGRELRDAQAIFRSGIYLMIQETDEAERLQVAEELAGASRAGVSAITQSGFLFLSLQVLMVHGQREMAEKTLLELVELRDRTREPITFVQAINGETRFKFTDGDFEAVVELAERTQETSSQVGYGQSIDFRSQPLARLARWHLTGDILDSFSPRPIVDQVIAHFAPDPSAADSAYLRMLLPTPLAPVCLEILADIHKGAKIDLSDAEAANFLLQAAVQTKTLSTLPAFIQLAEPFQNLCTTNSNLSCPAKHLGAAYRLLDKPAESRRYYVKAIEVCERIRFRPEIALIRLDLAELLLDHYPDEHDAAIEHLDFAIAELRDMKMQPALERALRHRGLLKA